MRGSIKIQRRLIVAKKAVVTGASEGIGKVFAERLAAEGYAVTAVARNEVNLKKLIAALGQGHQYVVADLATQSGQASVAKLLAAEHQDLLVNNAGIGTFGGFAEVDAERQLGMLRLNCEALVNLSHAFLVHARAGDALVNVSSTLAFTPMPGFSLYCATKAFVTAFSEGLWFEQKARNVYVMNLCPGITETNFQINAGGKRENVPANLAQTPEQVVDVAMAALAARATPTVISGGKNRLFASMSRLMSRKRLVSVMGKMMKA
jgi:short-subunit dehydrogenase